MFTRKKVGGRWHVARGVPRLPPTTCHLPRSAKCRWWNSPPVPPYRLLCRLHRGERGTISIVSVFAVLMLTMLLGMVMNVGRDVDAKIRLQNTADAVALSGGTVIARGLNVLAFTNHLLFDVLALTAFDRESLKVNDVDRYIPEILAEWNKLQAVFARSGFPKFVRLAPVIPLKTRLEKRLVDVYSVWLSASAALTLPIMEEILTNEWIPQFQRAVVQAYPAMAKEAAMRVAERNGPAGNPYGRTLGVLWGTRGDPVGFADETVSRTLPVVDPQMDLFPEQPQYLKLARAQREWFAKKRLGTGFRRGTKFMPTWEHHASTWTDEAFWMFDNVAKMCQFGNLFRGFACGEFEQLVNVEYAQSNLPFVILASNNPDDAPELPYLNADLNNNGHLDRYYTFVGVAYRRAAPEMMPPGLFRNPMRATRASEPYAAVAYATVRVFIPRPRLTWVRAEGGGPPPAPGMPAGGVPGQIPPLPPPDGGGGPPPDPARVAADSGHRSSDGRDEPPPEPEEPLPPLPGGSRAV